MYGDENLFVEAFGLTETMVLTNLDNPTATAVNTVPLVRALTDASALIDSFIARRYELPLVSTPQVLIRYSLDIARYMLDRIRNREDVRTRYEDAIEWLKSVAAGKVLLGLDTVAGVPVAETETVGFVSHGVSHSINMEGF